jgi:hypothetical protein
VSYDLGTFEQHAIYLAERMNVDFSSAVLWGPSGLQGFRYQHDCRRLLSETPQLELLR